MHCTSFVQQCSGSLIAAVSSCVYEECAAWDSSACLSPWIHIFFLFNIFCSNSCLQQKESDCPMETGVAGATHLTYWTEPFTPDLSHSNPLHSIPLNWTLHFTPGVIREVVIKVYMLRTQSVWENIAIEFRTLSLKRVLVHFSLVSWLMFTFGWYPIFLIFHDWIFTKFLTKDYFLQRMFQVLLSFLSF